MSDTATVFLLGAICSGLGIATLFLRRERRRTRALHDLRAIIDNIYAGVCLWDRDLNLIFCNTRYLEMKGAHADQMPAGISYRAVLRETATRLHAPSEVDQIVEKIIASVTNPDGSKQTIEMPNGEIHEVSSKSLTEGFLVTVEDITTRQRAIASDRNRRELLDKASNRLQSRLAEPIKSISRSVAALGRTAVALDDSSETASTRAGSALESSQGASASATLVAATTEQLRASIVEINQQLSRTTNVIRDLVGDAGSANNDMTSMSTAVQSIANVSDLISSIAGRTNLLALNATIEASRAGSAGKGFEVVASEVKSLSVQTARATDEISQRIGQVQSSAHRASTALETIRTKIASIDEFASSVAAALEQQGAATANIAASVTAVSGEARQVVGALSEVATSAAMTKSAAETVLQAARDVDNALEVVQVDLTAFFAEVA